MSLDTSMRSLCQRQSGVVSRSQLRRLGADRNWIRRRVRSGALTEVSPKILLLAGSPASARANAVGALLELEVPAMISHWSAAAVWGLPGFTLLPIHVTVPRGHRRITSFLATLHTSTDLPYSHMAEVDGMIVATPNRALYDLAGSFSEKKLELLTDRVWNMGMLTGSLLHRTIDEHAERGRPGTASMRLVAEPRGPEYRPPESNIEARFQDLAREVGIHTFERQKHVDGEDWRHRVDFLEPRLRIIAQVDGDMHHTSIVDRARDAEETARLESAGYIVVRFPEFEIWHRAAWVRQKLSDVMKEAKARLARSATCHPRAAQSDAIR